MKRLLISAGTLVFVGALAVSATGAFFSDTETSTGNTFAAGDIDLQIDNESYVTDSSGTLVASPDTSWDLKDLEAGVDKFFNFSDVKPGDVGEDTISIHVGSNDAWMCAAARITDDNDATYTDPELADDSTVDENNPTTTDGELDDGLNFVWWVDDGDNVLETDEVDSIFLQGPLSGLGEQGQITIADSQSSILGNNVPVPGNSTFYIGKAWCFGNITADETTAEPEGDGTPIVRGTGVTCDGASVNNAAQTDVVKGDMQFYAVQSRNNSTFTCAQDYTPNWPEESRELVGAALSAYVNPVDDSEDSCDFTVSGDESIQSANDGASDGDTICVDTDYTGEGDTFPVTLNVPNLTVAGLGNAGDADIPGGFFIDNSGITVKGLEFTDYSFIASSENAAVYIHNETGQGSGTQLTGTTVAYNIFSAPGGAKAASANGIITETGSGSTPAPADTSVMNNSFDGWHRAMFFNPSDGHEVAYNDILNNDVGVANDGPNSASIHNNDFEGNTEAVGVSGADNGTGHNNILLVNTNNIADGQVNNYNGSLALDATSNWWGIGVGSQAAQAGGGTVNTAPVEGSAFPEN